MDEINRDYIQNYIQGLIKDENQEMNVFRKECENNNRPIIQKEVAQFIKVVLSIIKPKKILEIGTNVGYSSIFMCKALNNDVDILTVEINEEIYVEALDNVKKFGCEKNIRIINGDAIELLDGVISEKFDIAFIDAAKSHYDKFLENIVKILNKDGVIICDNVLFKGLIANDDLVKKRKRTIVRNMRNFLESISNSDRFEVSVIPIGDGVALIKVI